MSEDLRGEMLRSGIPVSAGIAIGCTGGRHRSVALVEELRRRLGDEWELLVRHRDVDRGE